MAKAGLPLLFLICLGLAPSPAWATGGGSADYLFLLAIVAMIPIVIGFVLMRAFGWIWGRVEAGKKGPDGTAEPDNKSDAGRAQGKRKREIIVALVIVLIAAFAVMTVPTPTFLTAGRH